MQHSPLLDDPDKSVPLPCPLSHSLHTSSILSLPLQETLARVHEDTKAMFTDAKPVND